MNTYQDHVLISARNTGAKEAFAILQMYMLVALSEMVRSNIITQEQIDKFMEVLDAQIAAVEEKHFS